ncbi:MAG: transcription termination factor Rho, partial [Limisphaerales bacterium]
MNNANTSVPEYGSGYLEVSEKGFGFLRSPEHRYQPRPADVFVTPDTIKRHFLREGCLVDGRLQP